MKKHILITLLIVASISLACNLPARLASPGPALTAPPTGAPSPAGLTGDLKIPKNPVRITVSLDATHGVEAVAPVKGDTLTATGADGTVYQLVIPPNALEFDTRITLTPLTAVNGLPFGGGQTFGVQIAPEGLFLDETAVLTITPPQPIPVQQQILFGYRGDGENLILALPVKDSQEIKIQLMHFSGYGVTNGKITETAGARENMGADVESRFENLAGEQAQSLRQGEISMAELFSNAYSQYREKVIKPQIEAASGSCAAGRLAFETILVASRQAQLLVGDGPISAELDADFKKLLPIVAETCMKEEYQRCQSDHIIHRILPFYISWNRQYQLLGLTAVPGMNEVDQRLRQYVEKCLQFQVVFESTGVTENPWNDYTESHVTATIPMNFHLGDSLSEWKYVGQAPLVNVDFTYRHDERNCTYTANRGGGTFISPQLSFLTENATPGDQIGRISKLFLDYFPGNTSEEFGFVCQPDPKEPPHIFGPLVEPVWTSVYMVVHQGESNAEGTLTAADWEIFGNELFAQKEWTNDMPDLRIREEGSFKLYHRPGN